MEPTEDLVHPEGALVRYVDLDPSTGKQVVTRTETIYPFEVRAYQGVVVHPDHTSKRLAEDSIGVKRDAETVMNEDGVMGRASM